MAENIVVKITGDTTGLKSVKDDLVATGKLADNLVKDFDKVTDAVNGTEKEFKNLRQQLREAKNEAQAVAEKFGFNSKEAKAAQMKVAELADQMDDFNNRVKALDPEKKFNAFATSVGTVAGAFQGLTGMMRLFGGESKEAAAIVNKLTGVMMFAQGINSLFAMRDALKDLGVVLGITTTVTNGATAAQKAQAIASAQATLGTTALTAAQEAEAIAAAEAAAANQALTTSLLTNPAFLIIAGIAALGAAIYAMGDKTEEAEVKVKNMTESQKALRDATNETADAVDKLSVAQGHMSDATAEIRKLERDHATDLEDLNEKIRANNVEIEKNNKVIRAGNKAYEEAVERNAKRRADLREEVKLNQVVGQDYIDASKKLKELEQSNKDLVATIKKKNETTKASIDLIKVEAAEKAKDDSKKAAEQKNEEAKKAIALAEKQWQQEFALMKLRQKNIVDEAKTTEEKLALQQEYAVINYDYEKQHLESNGATATELKTLWETYYATRTALSAQQDKTIQDSCDKELAAEQKLVEAKIALRLKQESDPVKQAQIEMDALDDKYAKILSNEKLTATERETYNYQYLKEQLDITDKVTKATVDAEKVKQDAVEKTKEKKKKEDEEELARAIATKDALINGAQEFASMGFEITKNRLDLESSELEKQKEKGLISEEEYQKKVSEIKRKQAMADKQQAIFNATLNFASAMINALNMTPTTAVPAQLVLTAAIAGANLARIIATPIPKYNKGTLSVAGVDLGYDSVHAMLQPGEAVIPTAINKKYAPTIKAIYEQRISPKEINAFVRGNNNGSKEVLATVDTYALGRVINKNRNVNIENAEMLGKIIANEIGSKFNARNLI